MTKWLRFIGATPKTFMGDGVGAVQPNGVFPVPDEAAESYLRRDDVELDEAEPVKSETAEVAAEPEPVVEKPGRKSAAKAPAPPPEGEVSPE